MAPAFSSHVLNGQTGTSSPAILQVGQQSAPIFSCMLGQAHKKPWRTKKTNSSSSSSLRKENLKQPGGLIGVDHLISAQPGLVPQAKGSLTCARIWPATVFIDYATDFIYVGLMSDESGDLTLEAKHNFDHLCATRGIKVRAYHADNGRFAEKTFLSDVKRRLQRITFCGVGTHHQNGIAEYAIKRFTLTLVSHTLLMHIQYHWWEYITTILWPFALKAAQDRFNQLNIDLVG